MFTEEGPYGVLLAILTYSMRGGKMLLLLTVINSLAFAGYCYVVWFLTSPHFIEAFYRNITGEKYVKKHY